MNLESRLQRKDFVRLSVRALFLLSLFGFVFFAMHLPFSRDLERRESESQVTDKWTQISETQEGSYLYHRLRVKTDNREEIKINVDSEIYERVKIGDRLIHKGGKIEVKSEYPK